MEMCTISQMKDPKYLLLEALKLMCLRARM